MGEKKVELNIEELEERIAPGLCDDFFCVPKASFAGGKVTVDALYEDNTLNVLVGGRLKTPGREVFVPPPAIGRFL